MSIGTCEHDDAIDGRCHKDAEVVTNEGIFCAAHVPPNAMIEDDLR